MADESQNSSNGDGSSNPVNSAESNNQEAEKWKNDYLYLRAEFENYKRNSIKERSDLTKFGAERIARDLLPVIDNFERALGTQPNPQNVSDYVKGIEMTAQELKNVLQKNGIQEIPSEGQIFNPTYHEAVTSEEREDLPEGHVAKVFQKAYKMHDKVIRPGQVSVSQKPTSN